MPIAIDFETTYTKDRDIKTLGVAAYVEHPETEAYLVSMWGEGIQYVGHPANAPWALIDNRHWLSHNAAFDAYVFMELKRRGIIGMDLGPCEWDCTANMVASMNCKRDLASAARVLLQREVDKTVRDQMKGKRWETMTPEFREASSRYALDDARHCHDLWEAVSANWPEQERKLSRHTMLMCLRGVNIDMQKCLQWIGVAERALRIQEARIPWVGTEYNRAPVSTMSHHALKRECVKNDIPPPSTTADSSPIWEAWLEQWGSRVPFVEAYKNYGYINRVLQILYSIRDYTSYDGRLRYSLKYFGAHTGRWSGAGGINFQNFPRDPLRFDANFELIWTKDGAAHSIDLRHLIIPTAGKKFLIGDFCQIEAVVALWMAQDWEQLALIAQGMDSYEAHARRSMGYTDPRPLKDYVHAPDCPPNRVNMRQFAKCRRLGLQYGLGPVKFILIVKQWANLDITRSESNAIVADFREKEHLVVAQWDALERALRLHVARGDNGPFEVELPSWRSLRYYDCTRGRGISGYSIRGDVADNLYGGYLFQNADQALSRDVLGDRILATEGVIGEVVLHVHDEIIAEVDMDVPTSALKDIMEAILPWAPDMPVRAEVNESLFYRKF